MYYVSSQYHLLTAEKTRTAVLVADGRAQVLFLVWEAAQGQLPVDDINFVESSCLQRCRCCEEREACERLAEAWAREVSLRQRLSAILLSHLYPFQAGRKQASASLTSALSDQIPGVVIYAEVISCYDKHQQLASTAGAETKKQIGEVDLESTDEMGRCYHPHGKVKVLNRNDRL